MTVIALDTFGAPGRPEFEFYRRETRASKRQRKLDCGHRIDPTELYVYQVGKFAADNGIFQRADCDVCGRRGNAY